MTVVSMEIPYPPIHGGRVDVWRRLKMLSQLGVELQLVCWTPSVPKPEDVAAIKQYVQHFYPIFYRRNLVASLRRFIDLFSYSLEVSSRILRGKDWDTVLMAVKEFQPDVIMSDHIHCGMVALPLSQTLEVPMIVRSHDIEHLHYRYLMKAAKGHRKIARFLSQNHLESYEKNLFRKSLAFYDISLDDLEFWRNQGFTNGYFLPPVIEFSDRESRKNQPIVNDGFTEPNYDVVFLGNLVTENNVAGVAWFLQDVLPILKEKLPDIKVLIAGSNPTVEIKNLCSQYKDSVDLISNPPSAVKTYQSGKVLINPVSVGSGVSIKSIDMLAIGKPIVSLPKGLVGLPKEVKKYFQVAHDAPSFASAIHNCLTTNNYDKPERDVLESFLGITVIQNFLNQLEVMLQKQS
jgi:glycosyltransferase involved in cell wall biosynthesis